MIVPGLQNLTGYVGSTFDTIVTVYPSTDSNFNWTGAWSSSKFYNLADVAIAQDSNAYESLKGNTGINPVGDLTGAWSATPIKPSNLNGYSGTITLAAIAPNEYTQVPVLATPVVIQGVQGTMQVKFTSTQTATMTPGILHYFITIINPTGDQYYYLNGTYTWDSP